MQSGQTTLVIFLVKGVSTKHTLNSSVEAEVLDLRNSEQSS